jgi:alanyl-tRNA synthetase
MTNPDGPRFAVRVAAGEVDIASGVDGEIAERRKLAEELARHRARERYDAITPGADGMRRIVERAATLDELRALAQAIALLPKAVFVGVAALPHAVVLAASEDSGVNAGATLKAALAAHGGRGGGSPRVAQGTVGDAASLEAVVAALSTDDEPATGSALPLNCIA